MCAPPPFTLLTDNPAAGEFYANGNLIGTDTSSPYSFSWTNVAAGAYTLSPIATDAQGASTTSGVRTIVVDAPPTISLVADPTTAVAPATIMLTASANDADGTITKVEFFQGAALIATVNAPGPYTFTVNIAGAGIYSFTARATDNMGLTATSAAATVTVTVGAGGGAATIYYIYTDQLNTPRAITNEAATPVWTWDNVDPFGANAPNEDPDADANNFVFNLRFPGQYFDRETNTHYNYYRDYDPSQGRYVESDPIGLRAGPNTYAYVGGNPVSKKDLKGLLETWEGPGGFQDWNVPYLWIPRYGNWGGPYYGEGDPKDTLDRCFMEHDKCYAASGITMNTPSNACEKQDCNRNLCQCMKNISGNTVFFYGQWYRRGANMVFCN